MPYRKLGNEVTWHWCHNCSGWPLDDFAQREDKPLELPLSDRTGCGLLKAADEVTG